MSSKSFVSSGSEKKTVLFVVNEADFFLSHRLPIAIAAKNAGCRIHVAAPQNIHAQKEIESYSFIFHPIRLSRKGMNPFYEILTFYTLFSLFRKLRPQLVHLITIKPVLYGGMAARLAGIPAVIAAITGMGHVFVQNNAKSQLLQKLIYTLYRFGLGKPNTRVIFQNPDDQKTFLETKTVTKNQAVLIRGSGVDVNQFSPSPEPEKTPVILLASRMLRDKGIGEFVEAAKKLRSSGINARFVLAGDTDPGNPTAIPREQLLTWQQEGLVEWWGQQQDMPHIFAQSHIVCLPSTYREGVPKVLIEAAACARPIVTTDAPGCREIVRHKENGLLIPPKNIDALSHAISQLIANRDMRLRMGQRGREIAVAEFSVEKVVSETMSLYQEMLHYSAS